MKKAFVIPVCGFLLLLSAGCEGRVQSAGEEVGPDAVDVMTVDVLLTEYRANMPEVVEAGDLEFIVKNSGTIEHNLQIEGLGATGKFPKDLAPNETQRFTVKLEPGEYVFYCPVADHRSRGMETRVRVGSRP